MSGARVGVGRPSASKRQEVYLRTGAEANQTVSKADFPRTSTSVYLIMTAGEKVIMCIIGG